MSQPTAPALSVRSPLLISMSGIAALARVQRPVVSMWRRRFATSPHPFPSPVRSTTAALRFDAADVAAWLVATDHGNNPDAVLDAPAFADLELDLGDDAVLDLVSALLAIRGYSGSSLDSPSMIRATARSIDPADRAVASEIDQASDEALGAASTAIEMIAEAAFGTRGAQAVIDRRRARATAAHGADGSLSAPAVDLLVDLALELAGIDAGSPTMSIGIANAHSVELVSAIVERLHDRDGDHGDPEIARPNDISRHSRMLLRRLLVAGRFDALAEAGHRAPAATPAVAIARLPETDPLASLSALEAAVLDAPNSTTMVVIGPASLLTDAASRDVRDARAHILRTERVRGVVRLPAGLLASAPRHAMALWILAPAHRDVPIIDRVVVTADLDGLALGEAVRRDLVSDLIASLGSPMEVRAHAFRFARFSRTASLLAADGSLVAASHGTAMPRGVGASRVSAAQIPALLDRHLTALGGDTPLAHVSIEPTGAASDVASTTLGALVDEGDARVLPGTRIRDDQFDDDGFRVIGADLLTGTPMFVDRVRFALEFPAGKLTEPGDVVFVGGTTPRAIVDAEGSSVVTAPARVLRLADRSLVPEVVAADIARVGITVPWRRWPVRRVPLAQVPALRGAIASITAERAAAHRRLAQLDELETLVTSGVAAGSIVLTPVKPPAPTKGAP